jgi:hypothetical protein
MNYCKNNNKQKNLGLAQRNLEVLMRTCIRSVWSLVLSKPLSKPVNLIQALIQVPTFGRIAQMKASTGQMSTQTYQKQ